MSQVVKNPTPRQRFTEAHAAVKEHHEMLQRQSFQFAADMALLEYQRLLAATLPDNNGWAAAHLRLAGAQEFLDVFRNLGETPTIPSGRAEVNLNHRA